SFLQSTGSPGGKIGARLDAEPYRARPLPDGGLSSKKEIGLDASRRSAAPTALLPALQAARAQGSPVTPPHGNGRGRRDQPVPTTAPTTMPRRASRPISTESGQ